MANSATSPAGVQVQGDVTKTAETPKRPRRFGLSARLLILTILFGLLAEVLIYVPYIANYRRNWLENRISAAITAALVLEAAPNGMVSDDLAMQILDSIGAKMVALKIHNSRRMLAVSNMPPQVDVTTDLRNITAMQMLMEALDTLLAPNGRQLRVLGNAPMNGEFTEIVMDETPLRQAMLNFSRNLTMISLLISAITAGLVYGALSLMIVRPVRRLTRAMTAFADNPEDRSRIIKASGRGDEIGVAERELAAMQSQLVGTLQQKNRLAALGLAVAKINHDLRNLLAAAQLLSDRLVTSEDPLVKRFAPRLIDTLDRAIAFCQSTLSYGKAVEPVPARRLVEVAPLIHDARELLGLGTDERIAWEEALEPGLKVDADPDQLARVLLNITRNAVQTLDSAAETASETAREAGCLRISARREGGAVQIEIADNGPGVPDKARQRLFEAFSGSARPGGTGLGLAIAAELVRAHGGSLALLDAARGARFRITIPDRPAG